MELWGNRLKDREREEIYPSPASRSTSVDEDSTNKGLISISWIAPSVMSIGEVSSEVTFCCTIRNSSNSLCKGLKPNS